jgi:putative spermidine/putrescine transport system substrate-binding protein
MLDWTDRRQFLKSATAISVAGVAGCIGDDGQDEEGSTNGDDGNELERDFDGMTLDVMINAGPYFDLYQRHLVPRLEDKYNLNLNIEIGFTNEQVSKMLANRDNPPDSLNLDLVGAERLNHEDVLTDLDEFADLMPNYDDIYDKFKQFDGKGVTWEIGEVSPVINDQWDSDPSSWDELFEMGEDQGIVPFSWSAGPMLVVLGAALQTGDSFDSESPDIDAGFQYLQENVAPSVSVEINQNSQAKQLISGGDVDTLLPFWDYIIPDLLLEDNGVTMARRLDPVAIPYQETLVIPEKSEKKEAAATYINEVLSVEFQETMSGFLVQGVTNRNAQTHNAAERVGAPKPENFEDFYQAPHFRNIWENKSEWNEQWGTTFDL